MFSYFISFFSKKENKNEYSKKCIRINAEDLNNPIPDGMKLKTTWEHTNKDKPWVVRTLRNQQTFNNLPQYITIEQYKQHETLWHVGLNPFNYDSYKLYQYILDENNRMLKCKLLIDKFTLTPHYVYEGKSIKVADPNICMSHLNVINRTNDDLSEDNPIVTYPIYYWVPINYLLEKNVK